MVDTEITLPSTTILRPVPAWSRVKAAPASETDAAFAAGAALASLDAVVRSGPVFAGAWRQRLALTAAAQTLRHLGRREEEAALRDAWCFRNGGDNPGPAGRLHGILQQAARRSTGWSVKAIEGAASALDLDLAGRAGEVAALLDTSVRGVATPLVMIGELSEAIMRAFPQAEWLLLMLADLVLAEIMRWPIPVPLLMTQINNPLLRVGEPRRRPRPGDEGWLRTLATAYGLAATSAVDLAIDLERRAMVLQRVMPKLRAKGARQIVEALLSDDALTPASAPGAMTDRGLRRLFDRLVELGAVRELSGRPSFRIYGL